MPFADPTRPLDDGRGQTQPQQPTAGPGPHDPSGYRGTAPAPRRNPWLVPRKTIDESRPTNRQFGLRPVEPEYQRALEDAVPRRWDGSPKPLPRLRKGWVGKVNDGGPQADSGRGNNCVDCTRAGLATYYGDPHASAARFIELDAYGRQNMGGEVDAFDNMEAWTGAKYQWDGSGASGLRSVEDKVRAAGPGASAAVVVEWPRVRDPSTGHLLPGSSHQIAIVNDRGTVKWVDFQSKQISKTFPGGPVENVTSIVLDADRNPVVPAVHIDPATGQTVPDDPRQFGQQQPHMAYPSPQPQPQTQHAPRPAPDPTPQNRTLPDPQNPYAHLPQTSPFAPAPAPDHQNPYAQATDPRNGFAPAPDPRTYAQATDPRQPITQPVDPRNLQAQAPDPRNPFAQPTDPRPQYAPPQDPYAHLPQTHQPVAPVPDHQNTYAQTTDPRTHYAAPRDPYAHLPQTHQPVAPVPDHENAYAQATDPRTHYAPPQDPYAHLPQTHQPVAPVPDHQNTYAQTTDPRTNSPVDPRTRPWSPPDSDAPPDAQRPETIRATAPVDPRSRLYGPAPDRPTTDPVTRSPEENRPNPWAAPENTTRRPLPDTDPRTGTDPGPRQHSDPPRPIDDPTRPADRSALPLTGEAPHTADPAPPPHTDSPIHSDTHSPSDPHPTPDARSGVPRQPMDPDLVRSRVAEAAEWAAVRPDGLAAFADPRMLDQARRIPADPNGAMTIDMHSDGDGMMVGLTRLDEHGVYELAKANGLRDGQPIRLLGCEAGRDGNGLAARLAEVSGHPVIAADTLVFSDDVGHVFASDGYTDAFGEFTPEIPPTGRWHEFSPDGTRTRLSDSGFPPGFEDEGFGNWRAPVRDTYARGTTPDPAGDTTQPATTHHEGPAPTHDASQTPPATKPDYGTPVHTRPVPDRSILVGPREDRGTVPPKVVEDPTDAQRAGYVDADGNWTSANNPEFTLTAEQRGRLADFLDKGSVTEARATDVLLRVEDRMPDARLSGLEYRQKLIGSLSDKVAGELEDNPDQTTSQTLAKIKDSVRYTLCMPEDGYVNGVHDAVSMLGEHFELTNFKNTWGGDRYQGINSTWRDLETGTQFEVQFHTPDSLYAKEYETHEWYERARVLPKGDPLKDQFNAWQEDAFGKVPRPDGVVGLKVPVSDRTDLSGQAPGDARTTGPGETGPERPQAASPPQSPAAKPAGPDPARMYGAPKAPEAEPNTNLEAKQGTGRDPVHGTTPQEEAPRTTGTAAAIPDHAPHDPSIVPAHFEPPTHRPASPGAAPFEPPTRRPTSPSGAPRAQEPSPEDIKVQRNAEAKAALADDLAPVSPHTAAVVSRLLDDKNALNLTDRLRDPQARAETIATLREISTSHLLDDQTLSEYLADHPGQGPLFEPVAHEDNFTADGTKRVDEYVAQTKAADPVRAIGADQAARLHNHLEQAERGARVPDLGPEDAQALARLEGYSGQLTDRVMPEAIDELRGVIGTLPPDAHAEVNARAKNARGLVDKVGRMAGGWQGRAPRPDYQVGEVIDAVGVRITVGSAADLGRILATIKERFGTGDGGRVLEIENMYARPKRGNQAYRVIPLVVSIEVDHVPYTYELQLTTRRASVAADMEHNSVYKDYISATPDEADAVMRACEEAAAIEQAEASNG